MVDTDDTRWMMDNAVPTGTFVARLRDKDF